MQMCQLSPNGSQGGESLLGLIVDLEPLSLAKAVPREAAAEKTLWLVMKPGEMVAKSSFNDTRARRVTSGPSLK